MHCLGSLTDRLQRRFKDWKAADALEADLSQPCSAQLRPKRHRTCQRIEREAVRRVAEHMQFDCSAVGLHRVA